jgi:hypothetical protein
VVQKRVVVGRGGVLGNDVIVHRVEAKRTITVRAIN